MKILIILSLMIPSYALEIPLDESLTDWEILQNGKIQISWKNKNGLPFCKASTVYNSTSNKIKYILEDKKNYPNVFKRIESVNAITDDIVYIKLDLPFPFYGRDYVVKYQYKKENNIEYYIYKATEEVEVINSRDYVRLVNASGAWIIKPLDDTRTELIYIWNGELLGDFPDWALTTAWIEQGNEVLTWLYDALKL